MRIFVPILRADLEIAETYVGDGGLLLGQKATILDVLDIFALIAETARNEGVESLLYKPVPSVYHRYPSEEDRHALFQAGAVLETSALDSVVDLSAPLPQSALRRRGARKAEAAGITAFRREDPSAFHAMLSANLAERHGVDPVHSVDEMRLLAGRFADNIALWTAESGDGALLAGAWLFKCGPCVHVQYIATTPAGRELGALDLLLSHLMTVYSASARYFSFGVSNEGDGRAVNRGLFRQKTMFGGRGIVYEGYRLSFT